MANVRVKFTRRRAIDATLAAQRQAMIKVASEIEAEIKASVDVPYPPASTAGNPPHKRTGNLQKSIRVEVTGRRPKIVVRAGGGSNDVKYAAALEYGFPPRNLDPRPYVHPVINGRGQQRHWEARIKRLAENATRDKRFSTGFRVGD